MFKNLPESISIFLKKSNFLGFFGIFWDFLGFLKFVYAAKIKWIQILHPHLIQ